MQKTKMLYAALGLTAGLFGARQGNASSPEVNQPAAQLAPGFDVALEGARAALAACAAAHANVAVAVVDSEGALKVMLVADTARPIFADLAWRKARTAAHFKKPSSVIATNAKANPGLSWQLASGLFSYYGGGLPLTSGAEVIGALAVSGGASEAADEQCAKAGVAKMQDHAK